MSGGAGQFVVIKLFNRSRDMETSDGLCTLCRYSPDVYRVLVITTMITGKDNKCGKARVYERQNSLYNWHVVGHQDDKQTAIGKAIESDFAGERERERERERNRERDR